MITSHRNMLEDKIRCNAYKKAISEVVKPGHTVVDIGTGSGLLSYFAVMSGAKKVYAIDWGDIIEHSKKIAKANNWSNRIEFIKNASNNVILPEKVDVVISEILGSFAIEEDVVKYIADAKKRLLKKGGILLPARIEMEISPIEAGQEYENSIEFWNKSLYGVDFSLVSEEAINCRYTSSNFYEKDLLSPPQKIHTIDFYKLNEDDISINRLVNFEIKRRGTIHGIAGWFKAYLTENVMFSSFNEDGKSHWGANFFPIKKPIKVDRGDNILVKISGQKTFNTVVWTWVIEDKNAIKYTHSTFKSMELNKEKAIQGSLDYKPLLKNKEKEFIEFIFDRCDGTRSIRQISEALEKEYSGHFLKLDDAQNKVREVVLNNDLKTLKIS